jgi:hypothetical protein
LEAFRLLLEFRFSFWKGKPFVHLSDEAGVSDAMNGGHEISDGLRAVNGIHLPCGFTGFFPFVFRRPDKMPAEIVREKEILLQKEEIGIDVEETKSNRPSIQRFKGERHENSLQKWVFDRSSQGLYTSKLMIILEYCVLRREFFLKGESSYMKE